MSNLVKLCLIGILAVLAAIFVFKLPISSLLFFTFLIACPLMHMMMHGESNGKSHRSHKK